MQATILYKTKIDDESIVGAMSLVKDIILNNCIVAGVQAKVIRKNISWSRESCSENIMKCVCEYITENPGYSYSLLRYKTYNT